MPMTHQLEVLTSWWVIGIAVVLYVIEFFADKIPLVDSTWDVIHTFIRIPAGAVLAAGAFGNFDRSIQVIALLLGGGLALSSHGTKAATRAILDTSPEPVSNAVATVVEDILAVVSIVCSVLFPVFLFVIVGVGLVISFLVFRQIIRFLRQVTRSIRGWFGPATSQNRKISALPKSEEHTAELQSLFGIS